MCLETETDREKEREREVRIRRKQTDRSIFVWDRKERMKFGEGVNDRETFTFRAFSRCFYPM